MSQIAIAALRAARANFSRGAVADRFQEGFPHGR
jgi:hypothetical protein